jgi:hypothetical protein
VNEAQGMAAIQNKESIKVNGKNIFPYQYENGGFNKIKITKDSNDDTESLQLDMQGEGSELQVPENAIMNLLDSTSSILRSPNILVAKIPDIEQKPTIPLTITSVKLLPVGDNFNGQSFEEGGDIEIMNSPVKTGPTEFDIQMSPNRTKIVGGGGLIMRTASPRMQSHHRRKSSHGGPKFLDTVGRGPVQSDFMLDLMFSSVAAMKLKKSKKKKKKHSRSRRSKSRGTPSPQRRRDKSADTPVHKRKSLRGSRHRDRTLVTFEDKKSALDIETLQDHHHESINAHSSQQQEGLKTPRELKKRKSLSDLGKSQAIDVSVDYDDYGDILVPK